MGQRRQNFQNISWFWDLKQRDRLDMDPPYQRRSVWSNRYRQQFIDTVLLDYPAPAIFLFSRINETGLTFFEIVDGKQRLTAIYDFLDNKLPVGEESPLKNLRGKYFSQLDGDTRLQVYEYNFSVEYLPTNNEEVINNIFDRLNRNVARLTPQELRHARFEGLFIGTAERLAGWMKLDFETLFPRIADASRRQMKDVEFVATLLLFLEEGPKSYSVGAMDAAFSERDEEWDRGPALEDDFRTAVQFVRETAQSQEGAFLPQSRFRNQADYFSLFGAVAQLRRKESLPSTTDAGSRLKHFADLLEDPGQRERLPVLQAYYDAARSASNDAGPRSLRIQIVEAVLTGQDIAAHVL